MLRLVLNMGRVGFMFLTFMGNVCIVLQGTDVAMVNSKSLAASIMMIHISMWLIVTTTGFKFFIDQAKLLISLINIPDSLVFKVQTCRDCQRLLCNVL